MSDEQEAVCQVCDNEKCGRIIINCAICREPMHLTPSSGAICKPCKQLGVVLRNRLLECEPWIKDQS
jgi:hypothetical protein